MLSSRFAFRAVLGLTLTACFTLHAHAQFRLIESDEPWKETSAINPPPLSSKTLIPLESPPGSELRFGIDPDSISIADEQVVRYTIVMQGPAARSVVYEGLRCSTGEKRVYARQNGSDSEWLMSEETWQPARARYATELMRNGICLGTGTNRSVRDIVRDLRSNRGAGQLYGP